MELIEFNILHIKSKLKLRNTPHNIEKYVNKRLNKSLESYDKEIITNIKSLNSYKDTTVLKRI